MLNVEVSAYGGTASQSGCGCGQQKNPNSALEFASASFVSLAGIRMLLAYRHLTVYSYPHSLHTFLPTHIAHITNEEYFL